MLAEAAVVSLVVALLRGGKIQRLAQVPLRGIGLIFLALFVRFGALILALYGIKSAAVIGPYVQIASFLLLLMVIWINRDLSGFKLSGLGILLNLIVIAANGGQMPVDLKTAEAIGLGDMSEALLAGSYATHFPLSEETLFPFLGDIIAVPPPFPTPRMISIGDILLAVGVFFFIQMAMVEKRKI